MSETERYLATAASTEDVLPEMTAADTQAALEWVQKLKLEPGSAAAKAITGDAAAELGRALLRTSGPGRPRLDPTSRAGEESPQRRVRLPKTLDAQLDEYVEQHKQRGEKISASDVMREALAEYLRARQAS